MFLFFRKKRKSLFLQINEIKLKKPCSLLKHSKRAVGICVRHIKKIELSVKSITYLSQIYLDELADEAIKFLFVEWESCDNDIVMGKAVRGDKASNTVFFEKME